MRSPPLSTKWRISTKDLLPFTASSWCAKAENLSIQQSSGTAHEKCQPPGVSFWTDVRLNNHRLNDLSSPRDFQIRTEDALLLKNLLKWRPVVIFDPGQFCWLFGSTSLLLSLYPNICCWKSPLMNLLGLYLFIDSGWGISSRSEMISQSSSLRSVKPRNIWLRW